MRNFGLLVVFPRLDQRGPPIVAQVDAAAGRMVEARSSNLPAAYQRHHESVRQRPQLFRKVERERGPPCPWAMEESHLEIETDALQRTSAFGHHQPVAEAQHRVDGVPRRSPCSCRESELGVRHHLLHRPKVNPGGVSLDTPDMVACRRVRQTRDPLPDPFAAVGEPLAARRILLVT